MSSVEFDNFSFEAYQKVTGSEQVWGWKTSSESMNEGTDTAPTVYFQAGVHGAEIQGSMVLQLLKEKLASEEVLGKIIGIPFANPFASNQKSVDYTIGRFDPINGENFNRGYWDAVCLSEDSRKDEYQLNIESFAKENLDLDKCSLISRFRNEILTRLQARIESGQMSWVQALGAKLQRQAFEADLVIDLHTGPIATEYLYFPAHASERIKNLHWPFNIAIPRVFDGAMDEAFSLPWWHLYVELQKHGRECPEVLKFGVTLELESQDVCDLERAESQIDRIFTFLESEGVLAKKSRNIETISPLTRDLNCFKTLFSPNGGLVHYDCSVGETIKKGQRMARIMVTDRDSSEFIEINAPCDLAVINRFGSSGVYRGCNLFQYLKV